MISPILKAHAVNDFITGTQEKCLYCDDGYTNYFICPECKNGMCSTCYNSDTEHNEQLELLSCEEEIAQYYIDLYGTGWLCYSHLD